MGSNLHAYFWGLAVQNLTFRLHLLRQLILSRVYTTLNSFGYTSARETMGVFINGVKSGAM